MAENKTQKTNASVLDFINSVDHKKRKEDALVLLDIFKEETGEEPAMWGPSIIGYGDYRYEYASGRSGDWFYCGFSPRKASMSLYIMANRDKYSKLMENLGKYKTGVSCI
ncbi:DUF1801 domain-containing protein, partial [bacterium]|nr:DUF1801 domain-containing protein [bacterium]